MRHKIKNGVYIYTTNRGHHLGVQGMMETAQPIALNNHQPRCGTKYRGHGCQCEFCVGHREKDQIQEKIVKKELRNELDNL